MALADIYGYLAQDAQLASLLGGTPQDPRIYPDKAPKDTPLYLVYAVHGEGTTEEILGELSLKVQVFAQSAVTADAAINRVRQLLDLQDAIQGKIASADWNICWCKNIVSPGGIYEPDTMLYNRALLLALKFNRIGENNGN
jgi:hypothetical protein